MENFTEKIKKLRISKLEFIDIEVNIVGNLHEFKDKDIIKLLDDDFATSLEEEPNSDNVAKFLSGKMIGKKKVIAIGEDTFNHLTSKFKEK